MDHADTEKQVQQAFDQIFEALHATDAERLEALLADGPAPFTSQMTRPSGGPESEFGA